MAQALSLWDRGTGFSLWVSGEPVIQPVEILEQLAAAGIDLVPLPGLDRHFVFTRDGFAALVERKADGFGAPGSAGLLTEKGLAVLVWRGGEAWFVARGFEQAATPGQVESLRNFARDLESALSQKFH